MCVCAVSTMPRLPPLARLGLSVGIESGVSEWTSFGNDKGSITRCRSHPGLSWLERLEQSCKCWVDWSPQQHLLVPTYTGLLLMTPSGFEASRASWSFSQYSRSRLPSSCKPVRLVFGSWKHVSRDDRRQTDAHVDPQISPSPAIGVKRQAKLQLTRPVPALWGVSFSCIQTQRSSVLRMPRHQLRLRSYPTDHEHHHPPLFPIHEGATVSEKADNLFRKCPALQQPRPCSGPSAPRVPRIWLPSTIIQYPFWLNPHHQTPVLLPRLLARRPSRHIHIRDTGRRIMEAPR